MATRQHPDRAMHPSRRSRDGTRPALATKSVRDGFVFVFGGWNGEAQFNDLFMLDVENKDWSDLDLSWSVPRWNMASQLVEARMGAWCSMSVLVSIKSLSALNTQQLPDAVAVASHCAEPSQSLYQ
ncbi:unnamed protein product [Symbiodinium natans]|uniref:Uncharacterized protein n=1 Tax=Symbiodinium natans TaxID=878477 RepID=A0A812NBT8_9DINO|nr:unnamed protein product [Symbiodinium natans]